MPFSLSLTKMLPSLALLVVGLASGACQVEGGESGQGAKLGQSQQSIVNGDLSTDESVVALVSNGEQFCSGTVVGKRTVLTAAHCLPPHVNVSLSNIRVSFGDKVDAFHQRMSVVDALANPSWNSSRIGGDVGVLALAEDAPVEAMPMAYLDVGASGTLGQEVRAVGFGMTSADGGGNGTRRSGMLTVDRFDTSSIFLNPGPSATCSGDSGGALIFVQDGVEVIGGIHSRSDCDDSIIAERVDVHTMNFIMPFIEEHEGSASCEADGLCAAACDSPDPDCACAADGMCTDACPHPSADADCGATCPADGICDESCDYDYDCVAPASGGENICPEGGDNCESTVGCNASGKGDASWLGFAFIFLALFSRRRFSDARE